MADRLRAIEQQAQAQQWKVRADGHVRSGDPAPRPVESERRAIGAQLSKLLDSIQSMGIIVRDIRGGLIDFPSPSPRDGHIIYLCWRRGEPHQIRWWHEIAAGFAGRQPL